MKVTLDLDKITSGDIKELDHTTQILLKICLQTIDDVYMPLYALEAKAKGHFGEAEAQQAMMYLSYLTGVFEPKNHKEGLLKFAKLGSRNQKEILFTGAYYCLFTGDNHMAKKYFQTLSKYFEGQGDQVEAEKYQLISDAIK